MGAAAADVVLVFGDIGQQRKIAERAHQLGGLFLAQRGQRLAQQRARFGIGVTPETDRDLADRLDALEGRVAVLGADGVAQQAAQLADIAPEQVILTSGKI